MNKCCLLLGTVILLAATPVARAATGLAWIDKNTNLTFYGDLRLRYELDWDSQTPDGTPRDDRIESESAPALALTIGSGTNGPSAPASAPATVAASSRHT